MPSRPEGEGTHGSDRDRPDTSPILRLRLHALLRHGDVRIEAVEVAIEPRARRFYLVFDDIRSFIHSFVSLIDSMVRGMAGTSFARARPVMSAMPATIPRTTPIAR